MAKQTQYDDVKNILLVVRFNEPAGEAGQKYQPVIIEARCEALTTEGAVRNVVSKTLIGAVQDAPLTLRQIYINVNKTTVGGLLANILKEAILDALNIDPSV
jgi:hypothetical protein